MRRAAIKVPTGLAALALMALPSSLALAARPAPSPAILAEALQAFGVTGLAVDDIRSVRCEDAKDAAGALDCQWEQRSGGQWQTHTTWLGLVGAQWTVLDVPIVLPSFDRGRLKPLPRSETP